MQLAPDPDYDAYQRIFTDNYDSLNYGRSLVGMVMSMGHQLSERAFKPTDHFGRVLEVGAGSAEHIRHVRHGFDEYVLSDRNLEMLKVSLEQAPPEPSSGKVTIDAQDATQLTYADDSFDRLIATHVLEHLPEPHKVLREWARVIKPGGVMTLIQPCDPGFAWTLGRKLGPRRSARKRGMDYDYWMAREHINSIHNINAFLDFYFTDIRHLWFPALIPSNDLNLFHIVHVRL